MERITELIQHPERMDRDTLYELRSLCALYPYYQTVRLLMLQNLYLLHDPTFDEELRRAAIYITDRRVLFNMIEASHYQLKPQTSRQQNASAATAQTGSRTMSLINTFLDSIPKEEEDTTTKKRKPTATRKPGTPRARTRQANTSSTRRRPLLETAMPNKAAPGRLPSTMRTSAIRRNHGHPGRTRRRRQRKPGKSRR